MQDRNGSVSRRCVRRVLTMVGNLEKNERMIREHRATDEWTIELGGRSSQAPSRTIASGGGNRLEMDPELGDQDVLERGRIDRAGQPFGPPPEGFRRDGPRGLARPRAASFSFPASSPVGYPAMPRARPVAVLRIRRCCRRGMSRCDAATLASARRAVNVVA